MTPFHRGKGVFPTPSGLLGLLYIALGFVGIIIVSSNSCSFGDDTENRLSGPPTSVWLLACLVYLVCLAGVWRGFTPPRQYMIIVHDGTTEVLYKRYCFVNPGSNQLNSTWNIYPANL